MFGLGRKKSDQESDPSNIGNVLIRLGYCTREDIERAKAEQERQRERRLGEHLIAMEVITEEQLQIALAKQNAERPGRLQHESVARTVSAVNKQQAQLRATAERVTEVAASIVATGGVMGTKILSAFFLLGVLCAPLSVSAQPETERRLEAEAAIAIDAVAAQPADLEQPSTPQDVVEDVGDLINGVRTGTWTAIAGAVIMLLLNLLRLPLLKSLTHKIPKRWRLVIAIVLGGAAGIIGSIAGGLPWYEAVYVGLFSGPSAVFSHELIYTTILGKRGSPEPDPGPA